METQNGIIRQSFVFVDMMNDPAIRIGDVQTFQNRSESQIFMADRFKAENFIFSQISV